VVAPGFDASAGPGPRSVDSASGDSATITTQVVGGLDGAPGEAGMTSTGGGGSAPNRIGWRTRIFGNSQFFRLWVAQVVSATGDWLGFLAITILAARVGAGGGGAVSGGGTAVGVVMLARIVPGFFLAPVAGVMIDRWDRRRTMVVCDVLRAGVVATLPWVDSVAGLVVASLVLEVCTLLWSPAKEASVPNLIPADRLASANSLSLAAAYGTFPLAAGLFALLAGLATWLGGFDALRSFEASQESLAFYVDVVTFALSALLISGLRLPSRERPVREPGKRIALTGTMTEMREGWQFIFLNPVVRSVNLGLATGLIGGGMVVPLGAVFVTQVLGQEASGYGTFVTALGFGVALGVVLASVVQTRVPKTKVFSISLVVGGSALIAAATMNTLAPAAALVSVLGVAAGSVYVIGFTLLHETVEDELRGRIFAALFTLVRLCLIIAFAIGPLLSDSLDRLTERLFHDQRVELPWGREMILPGVRVTLWLAGAFVILAGLLSTFSLWGGVHRPVDDDKDDLAVGEPAS
jgi:dTMP kinase